MNQAHFHLVVNHLPIIVPMIGLLVMIGGLIFKSDIIKRTAYCIFIVGALSTFPAMATGEGAEEVIENIAGIEESYIENHEETAETFAIFSYLLGFIALIGLVITWKFKSASTLFSILTILFTVVVLYFGKETGTTGGEIRHTEIRQDFGNTNSTPNVPNVMNQKRKGDDDNE